MYKDKDKQKEADRLRQQRRRDAKKLKGVTIPGCDEGVTNYTGQVKLYPKADNYGQPDCQCQHCQSKRVNHSSNIINHTWKPASQLVKGEVNRVSLPGDADYKGVAHVAI